MDGTEVGFAEEGVVAFGDSMLALVGLGFVEGGEVLVVNVGECGRVIPPLLVLF